MDIRFATTNPRKFATAQAAFETHGLKLHCTEVEFIEPQDDDIGEIVRAKLAQASNPTAITVVEDTAIGFGALNGFPGPYVKYAIATLGCSGLLRLLAQQTDRTVTIDSVCGAQLPGGHGKPIFERTVRSCYRVTTTPTSTAGKGWSDIWQILRLDPSTPERERMEPNSLEKMAQTLSGLK